MKDQTASIQLAAAAHTSEACASEAVESRKSPRISHDFIWCSAIVLIGLIVRAHFLMQTGAVVDSDEAIVGLMAKHILEGSAWPVFYYGQSYMGSLEAILVAGSFSLFGMSGVSLKVVPLFFSLLHILLVYALAERIAGKLAGRIAAFLTALGPSALILWSVKARGGFIELVVIGSAALLIAVDLHISKRPRLRSFFWLGGLLGLGWWVNNQIVFYGAPLALVFAVHLWWKSGALRMLRTGAIGSAGFLLGGFPFWWANFTHKPRFQSFWIFDRASLSEAVAHLGGYFTEALPIILGARRFWSREDIFFSATPVLYSIHAVCIVVLCALAWRQRRTSILPALLLLLLFLICVPIIFSFSQFGWLSQAPRYLLPLYSVVFVVVGVSCSMLWQTKLAGARALGLLIVLTLTIVHFVANFADGGAVPGQPFVFKGERVAKNHGPLIAWLRAHNYHHVQTNYWIGYRLAFETAEDVTFSRFRGPKVVRIPDYEQRVESGLEQQVLVLVPEEAKLVSRGLRDLGYTFRSEQVSGYFIFHHLEPYISRGPEIKLRAEQVRVPSRPSWGERLIDGNLGTRWGSGMPQEDGMTLEIWFDDVPMAVSGIEVDYGFWPQDYPRELEIYVEEADGSRCTLLDTRENIGLKYVIEDAGKLQLTFPPKNARVVRLVQHGSHPVFDWSIAELRLYAPNLGQG